MGNRFNLEYDIPENKLVKIYKSGETQTIIPQPLIMDDEISIKCSSKFGQLWEASPNNFLNLLSSSLRTSSGQFALQGAQIWQSTDPLSLSIKCRLEMDTDSYQDVVYPSKVLMQTCLPEINEHEGYIDKIAKKINNNLKLKTLIPPGPNIQALLREMGIDSETKTESKGVYDITIGFVTLKSAIITSVEPTYSKSYAVSSSKNKLFPSSADLSIEIQSMEIATTDMIENIM